jgi:predicted sugar kinase
MSTAAGQKMSIIKRVERLMPHEMTTKLFEEMTNLRLKRTGSATDIVLEQINPRFPKDKYSSFAYGLWRIKELEEEYTTKRRRRMGDGSATRRLTFFN